MNCRFYKLSPLLILLLFLFTKQTNAASYEGYTLYATGQNVQLIDMQNNLVHSWKASASVVCVAYLLEDGSVFVGLDNRCSVSRDGAHPSGRFQKISWDGNITWDFTFCNTTYTPGYDAEPLPNGNVLIPADNSSSAGALFEVKPNGTSGCTVVWQCVLPTTLNAQGTYINSVSYNPNLDKILVDLQEPARKLVVIDHSVEGGKVDYTYAISGSGRVHGAKWSLPYYMGTKTPILDADTSKMRINNLLVVHNSGEAVEVNMTTNTLVKSYKYSFSNNEGSVQRLPNGNLLIQKGMDQTTITEVDDNGATVATLTAKGRCSRAYRYGPSYPGVSLLKSTAITATQNKQPIQMHITVNDGMIKLNVPHNQSATGIISIFTRDGKLVLKKEISTTGMAINHLPVGMYCYEFRNPVTIVKGNFVKIK